MLFTDEDRHPDKLGSWCVDTVIFLSVQCLACAVTESDQYDVDKARGYEGTFMQAMLDFSKKIADDGWVRFRGSIVESPTSNHILCPDCARRVTRAARESARREVENIQESRND